MKGTELSVPNPVRLPLEIKRNGATYEFVMRGDKTLLYARTVHNQGTTYEVFRIRVRRESVIHGKIVPRGEIFPNDEAFGVWAWTAWTLEKALTYFLKFEG